MYDSAILVSSSVKSDRHEYPVRSHASRTPPCPICPRRGKAVPPPASRMATPTPSDARCCPGLVRSPPGHPVRQQ
eukprot:11133958-Alexandrium_andersonii.AAC.1